MHCSSVVPSLINFLVYDSRNSCFKLIAPAYPESLSNFSNEIMLNDLFITAMALIADLSQSKIDIHHNCQNLE